MELGSMHRHPECTAPPLLPDSSPLSSFPPPPLPAPQQQLFADTLPHPGTVLSLSTPTSLNPHSNPTREILDHSHFTDKTTEALKRQVACL